MSTESPVEILVVGAGPAGLTAAYALAKAGRGVTVLEADPTYVGGISRTVNHNGYLFDIGGHRFFSKSREVEDLWDEILPNDFLERPRLSRIYYSGKFYAYPLKAFEALANLGLLESTRCVASFVWAKLKPIRNVRTFHDWVRNQFGERLFSIFFKTYTEKVWGMSCDEISSDWAAQRIKSLDLAVAIVDAVKRSVGLHQKALPAAKTLIESFRYPRKGPGMMWESCAAKITEFGGRIAMGRTVTALEWDESNDIWRVIADCAGGGQDTYTARHVISSAPLRDLVEATTPHLKTLAHARSLKYRDFLTVVLIGRTNVQLPDNWIYIHDPAVKVGRVQNFRSWSPEMIPDADSTCLGLEYFCFEDDSLWNSTDEHLIALAKSEIARIGLMDSDDVSDACVVRQAKAYPVYDETYQVHVNALKDEMARRLPTLHPVGRNGMHKYNNQDHAMITGLLTAKNIMAGETVYDIWGVNEDAEYSESGISGAREALASQRLVPARAS